MDVTKTTGRPRVNRLLGLALACAVSTASAVETPPASPTEASLLLDRQTGETAALLLATAPVVLHWASIEPMAWQNTAVFMRDDKELALLDGDSCDGSQPIIPPYPDASDPAVAQRLVGLQAGEGIGKLAPIWHYPVFQAAQGHELWQQAEDGASHMSISTFIMPWVYYDAQEGRLELTRLGRSSRGFEIDHQDVEALRALEDDCPFSDPGRVVKSLQIVRNGDAIHELHGFRISAGTLREDIAQGRYRGVIVDGAGFALAICLLHRADESAPAALDSLYQAGSVTVVYHGAEGERTETLTLPETDVPEGDGHYRAPDLRLNEMVFRSIPLADLPWWQGVVGDVAADPQISHVAFSLSSVPADELPLVWTVSRNDLLATKR